MKEGGGRRKGREEDDGEDIEKYIGNKEGKRGRDGNRGNGGNRGRGGNSFKKQRRR